MNDPESYPEPDCAYPLIWNGVRHTVGADLGESRATKPLGTGVVLGCGDPARAYVPDETVTVRRIRGVDPSVAVAGTLEGGSTIAWLAPGYIAESPRHPLHDAIYGGPSEPDARDGFLCGRPLTTRARALSTHGADGEPLRVQAEDASVESLLIAEGTDRIVSLDADTVITGLERHGIPYVHAGDEFTLAVRVCDGKESEPGLVGLRLLVADRLSP